jgi:hypothetical protein
MISTTFSAGIRSRCIIRMIASLSHLNLTQVVYDSKNAVAESNGLLISGKGLHLYLPSQFYTTVLIFGRHNDVN